MDQQKRQKEERGKGVYHRRSVCGDSVGILPNHAPDEPPFWRKRKTKDSHGGEKVNEGETAVSCGRLGNTTFLPYLV